MPIPTQSSRPRGKRLNKLPVVFAVIIVLLFAAAMAYVATEREKKKVMGDSGAKEGGYESGKPIGDADLRELVDAQPDVAGIHYDPPPPPEADGKEGGGSNRPERDIRQEVLKAIQDQQLRDLQASQKAKAENKTQRERLEAESYMAGIDVEVKHLDDGKDADENKPGAATPSNTPSAVGSQDDSVPSENAKKEKSSLSDDVFEKREYLKNKSNDRFVLDERTERPLSDYEVKTGSVIPGTLVSAINSSLPGDIVAQVSRNVYDSRTGKHLLIPQGSKLYGRYDSATVLGQNRLLVVWDRIIFPDTETLSINSMQGVDGRGLSGFKDKVNTHFVKTLLNAFLLSAVSATADKYDKNDSSGFLDDLRSEYGDTMERVISAYLNKRLNIKPEIEIRAGMQFNILVSKDLVFNSPYQYGFSKRIVKNEHN